MSACMPLRPPACLSSASFSRRISSRDRNRESLGRRFGSTDAAGLESTRPRSMANFRLWRRSRSAEFAPPGAVLLYSSNQSWTA